MEGVEGEEVVKVWLSLVQEAALQLVFQRSGMTACAGSCGAMGYVVPAESVVAIAGGRWGSPRCPGKSQTPHHSEREKKKSIVCGVQNATR